MCWWRHCGAGTGRSRRRLVLCRCVEVEPSAGQLWKQQRSNGSRAGSPSRTFRQAMCWWRHCGCLWREYRSETSAASALSVRGGGAVGQSDLEAAKEQWQQVVFRWATQSHSHNHCNKQPTQHRPKSGKKNPKFSGPNRFCSRMGS